MDLRLLSSILMLCALAGPMVGAIAVFAGAPSAAGWVFVALGGLCLLGSFLALRKAAEAP